MYFNFMGFNENLRNEIEYQGIKIKDLSERSGINKRTLDHYLLKKPQEPSVTNAYKIAKSLNVSVEYLVTGADSMNQQYFSSEFVCYLNKIKNLSVEKRTLLFKLIDMISQN